MRLQFCGADRTVTGSCHLIEVNGLRLLLDCGMYQGKRDEARRLNQYVPADAHSVDALVLSHGHLDHCGKLPVFTRAGFAGPIYCTPATAEVARIVLNDAAEIQVEDAQYLNRRAVSPSEEPLSPLYTPDDIPGVLKLFKRTPLGRRTDLGNGVAFTFFDAGHILGSAYVLLEWEEAGRRHTLLFTGDIGRYGAPILRDPHALEGPADLVITESTYGNADHAPMEQVGPQLLDAAKFCVDRGSRLVVPAFAVGRTQTILWYMRKFFQDKLLPPMPVFVDSPMGVEVSKVHHTFRSEYDQDTLNMVGEDALFQGVTFTASREQSKQVNRNRGPCVIVASSPTCEFGRILHHLAVSVENENDVVVFCGWIPPNTLGRRLQDGQKRVRIFDRWYDVQCQVRTIHGLSAHADRDELLRFLGPTLVPQTTAYVVHGEVPQAEGFARTLLGRGVGNAVVPAMETSVIAYRAPEPKGTVEPRSADAE
jgi:metallo-beta-lactamase family protein